MSGQLSTTTIQGFVDRINAGDAIAQDDLVRYCQPWLEKRIRDLMQFRRVRRWEQPSDVFQRVALKLLDAVEARRPVSSLHFSRTACKMIRQVLTDCRRRYYGPEGLGENHQSDKQSLDDDAQLGAIERKADGGPSPDEEAARREFHQLAETVLSEHELDVVNHTYYLQCTLDETATSLNLTVKQVRGIRDRALLKLNSALRERGMSW